MRPCGTPISCSWGSDKVDPTRIWKFRFRKKCYMNSGKCPLRPMSWRSFTIPCFQFASYAFSKTKKTVTTCWLLIKASLINVSNPAKWSSVLRWRRKPHWILVIKLLDSRNQVSLALIILSIVLHTQLVIRRVSVILSGHNWIGTTVASLQEGGNDPDSHTLLKIYRRNVRQ